MTQILPRFYRRQCEAEAHAAVDAAVREARDDDDDEQSGTASQERTKPGDPRLLRGVPIIAMGVGGTSPGTSPFGACVRLGL